MAIITESLAARLGGQLGQGLGSGLDLLANAKFKQLADEQAQAQVNQERQRIADTYGKLYGKEAGNFLANIDEKARAKALENPSQLLQLNKLMRTGGNQKGIAALSAEQNMPAGDMQDLMQALNQAGLMRAQSTTQPPSDEQMPSDDQEREKILQDLFTSPRERREQERLKLDEKKITSREDLAAWKNTQKYREKILADEQAAIEALESIKEAQELEKSGDFPSQQFASFLKGAEWEDVPGFLSGEAEAFNKILANFQRGAKEIYGGRITNFEMEQFLKTIPTLQHTPEGRARIFSMMKKYYKAGKERAKIERQIIKQNRGVPPQDLNEQVNEKFKPIAKEIARKFKAELKDAEKLKNTTAQKLGTIASYGVGKLVSAIPSTLAGAAKGASAGAIAGSVIPALGTATGALLGGGLGALGGASGGGSGLSSILKLLI